jgi:hypothetical protein
MSTSPAAGKQNPERPNPARQDAAGDAPWFVDLFYGIGGWVAGLLLLAFLTITFIDDPSGWQILSIGVFMLAGATFLSRLHGGPFFQQFALAIAIAGNAAIFMSFFDFEDSWDSIFAFGPPILAMVSYPFYRAAIYRFLIILWAWIGPLVWLLFEIEEGTFVHIWLAAELAALFFVFVLRPEDRMLRPFGFASAITAVATPSLVLVPGNLESLIWWPSHIIGAVFLLALILAWRPKGATLGAFMVVLVAAALGGLLTSPGISIAIGLLAIGHRSGELLATLMGLISLPIYFVVFYYDLDLSLTHKSYVLAAGGIAFLLARVALLRFVENASGETPAGAEP